MKEAEHRPKKGEAIQRKGGNERMEGTSFYSSILAETLATSHQ